MATSTATPAATTADGEEGLAQALDGQYDVLIVDRRLPKLDGLTVIGSLRSKGIETPALILSALGQIDDRVKGLRAGGDDYLPKPYSFFGAVGAHGGVGAAAQRPRGNGLSRRRPRARPPDASGNASLPLDECSRIQSLRDCRFVLQRERGAQA